ncbi:uncharacterized protein N7446_010533 [Penicillium canescens]|uniref:Uncharacterized protein n=1 Tax=Penicillium canescens TaxID=5083 RepID=A0AAD6IDG2_PENCN|nr:uncharacterized protein N7446_010533 [Penicillium canescens]KAJ6041583.1 hypothetical protein N7460_006973 [Penicillium canescens]KAJ6050424.1 hypothetical protein N7446_010533 [Penicillium canescens]KAJ6064728.1 hypothetical protein N7444_000381 [Penicillium canescens]
MSDFDLANKVQHLIIQPADLRLNPPESYLYVQDGLIISCGFLYVLCYLFCTFRAYKDQRVPGSSYGSVQYLCLTMAYEFFYAFTTTSTTVERVGFLAWFIHDFGYVAVILKHVHRAEHRPRLIRNMLIGLLLGIAGLKWLTTLYPDDREQVTAYWTGILLQLPIGWVCLHSLYAEEGTRGHSLEMWITRYLGCYLAYGVFIWRYLNVPQNWEYVASPWSIAIMVLTLLPETIYPFCYVWVYKVQKVKGE